MQLNVSQKQSRCYLVGYATMQRLWDSFINHRNVFEQSNRER